MLAHQTQRDSQTIPQSRAEQSGACCSTKSESSVQITDVHQETEDCKKFPLGVTVQIGDDITNERPPIETGCFL